MLKSDIQQFSRRLRLKEYFKGKENDEQSLVRNKSIFTPKPGRDTNLDHFIETIYKFPINTKNCTQNLNKSEKTALANLKNNTSIILKEADKGGAIVIMDKDYYKNKVMEQLNDEEYYLKQTNSNDKLTIRKLKLLVEEHAKSLTDKEIAYLCDFTPKESNFYGLPKVHKSKTIQEAVTEQNTSFIEILRPDDLKLRPIVAGPESATQRLSQFLDLILKPLCPTIPSYIKDDMDFLKYIPETVPANTILTSFDVTSLYTNIPHELGISAIQYWVDRNRNLIDNRFTTDFIVDAIKIVLEDNTFFFNGEYYKQIKGTAMGTKVAPTYANLVMAFLENILYQKVRERYDEEFRNYIYKQWKRYLDDCFIFWNKSFEELETFHEILNTLHPSIKFTKETNYIQLPFLDILVKIDQNKVITDIFYKKTDTHQYLNFKSCHPSHTKRNIPYTMARRICAIVLDNSLRTKRLEELKSFLQNQNYPIKLIEDGIKRANALSITELRKPKEKNEKSNLIPFVTTHDPALPNIFSYIKSNIPILHQSEHLKTLINDESIIYSRRQPMNLKRHLTTARFNMNENSFCVKICGDKRCGVCSSRENFNYLQTGSEIKFNNGKNFKIKANMTCKTKNLIYCIICTNCKEEYVGQTGNSLSERVRIHKQQIRQPEYRQIPLSEHLEVCAGGKFKIFPFYKCQQDNEEYRKETERKFIKLFQPKLNAL